MPCNLDSLDLIDQKLEVNKDPFLNYILSKTSRTIKSDLAKLIKPLPYSGGIRQVSEGHSFCRERLIHDLASEKANGGNRFKGDSILTATDEVSTELSREFTEK